MDRSDYDRHWLNPAAAVAGYTKFAHRPMAEIPNARDLVKPHLSAAIVDHHTHRSRAAHLLAELGHTATAAEIAIRLPKNDRTRKGNFGEVVASEHLRQRHGYAMPVFKLRFRDHQNLPMRGEDIVAFVTDANGMITKVCIGEAKTLVTFAGQTVASAHERLKKTARHILAALENERRLDSAAGIDCRWKHTETREAWDKSRIAIAEDLGPDSDLLKFLNEGFVVHHSGLPTRVRLSFETLIRTGEVRLIIATTTLSSGVNLPIRTVLVRGLQQGQNREVSALDFWNIAGRAGRALCENEGQILFFVDETKAAWQVDRITEQIKNIIETTNHASVLGTLVALLRQIYGIWRSVPNAPDLARFCLKLAEDDFDWAGQDRLTVHGLLQIVDQHLLALTSEAGLENDAIDQLQELLRQSLLLTRLGVSPVQGLDEAAALGILHSRLRSVHRRIPNQQRRGAFYRMGFSIDDCRLVEAEEGVLLAKYRAADAWGEWDQNTRIAFLKDLADFALKLDTIRGATNEQLPENFGEILIAWLGGSRSIDISQSLVVDASHIGKVIEAFCVYSLSWAANSFFGHLHRIAEASGVPLPAVCSFFSSMFKFGLCDPLAALFAPYLDGSRTFAILAAGVVPYSIHQADRALAWFHEVTAVQLQELGLSAADADGIVRSRRANFGSDRLDDQFGDVERFRFTFYDSAGLVLNAGDRILIKADHAHPTPDFTLYTVRGRKLGAYHLAHSAPIWWHLQDQIDAEVEETSRDEARNLSAIVTVRRI